ncbi:MAG: hypothetical protein WD154_07705 [Nitrosopumilaceae archaeon]
MATISANVTKKELDAIREYANAWRGETTSNLIRKVVIQEINIPEWFGGPKEYQCNISMSNNLSGKEEYEILQNSISKIRRILGIEEITKV